MLEIKGALLPVAAILINLISDVSVFRLDSDSAKNLDLWQEGSLDSVLPTLDKSQGVSSIYLTHWDPLKNPSELDFSTIEKVDLVYSCYPEFLPENVRKKHISQFWRSPSNGSNAVTKVGNFVIFIPNFLE